MTSTLIVAHRRVETVKQVVRSVVDAGVIDVWAWVDGPRTPTEAKQTSAVARLLESQDWPGDFHLLENRSNHGVAAAVPAALDWVFAHRDEVIVLEDDCVPTLEFFGFVNLMLERYRHDHRVALVSGTRIAPPQSTNSAAAYEFSMFPLIWGWATWRDRWSKYRHDIRGWQKELGLRQLVAQGGLLHAWDWYRLFNSVAKDDPWSWDYQLTYMLWSQNQMAILPRVDLVENIGFGDSATHTNVRPAWSRALPPTQTRTGMIDAARASIVPVSQNRKLDQELRRVVFSPPLHSRLANLASYGARRLRRSELPHMP